ncbi:L-methionine/branched-chain amino acid transporter [Shewanella colwelliana]|uniref:L-methionine/branched-chain amino acid transporter n=1 Tax=Shewanella colwelliana TaxID=23 RepID=UPI00048D2455|nr:L-methionine/branched-chain amino acid transporter [Shewanella colwelliana]
MHIYGTISRWQGVGLMVTTLLGTGVFILPEMTISLGGDDAFYAWVLLTFAMIPVASVFALLAKSSSHKHAAGSAFFVEKAFGQVMGRTTGLVFLLVIPICAPAAIMMTFKFVNSLVLITDLQELILELLVLILLLVLNLKGMQSSAAIQFSLTIAIVSVVMLMLSNIEVHSVDVMRFSSFEVEGSNILKSMSIAFWSFLGIEAMTYLIHDFKRPKDDIQFVMILGTVLVGLVYVACTVLLLFVPPTDGLAMVAAFDRLLGGYGAQIIGVLGIAGGLSTVNVYTASVARLIWSFSREGVLPRYFDQRNEHQVPVRALVSVLSVMACVIVLTYLSGQELEHLIAWTNGVFVIIYFASMMAAAKLLSKRYLPLVVCGVLFCAMMAIALGASMLYALSLVVILAPLLWWQKTHHTRKQVSLINT